MSNNIKLTGREIMKKLRDYNMFTWVPQEAADDNIAVAGGKGCWFWDYEGNKYLDAASQLVNVNVGLQHEKVVDAVKKQADQLCYINPVYGIESRAILSEKIIKEAAPEMGKVLYTLTGSDCNELAVRVAQDYTKKHKMFSQYVSYHGFSYGSICLAGQAYPRGAVGPEIGGFIHFIGPWWREHGLEFDSDKEYSDFLLRMLEKQILQEGPDRIAGIITESVLCCGGVITVPEGYLEGVRALCDKYEILLIIDETMSGFGRTGKWFNYQHYDIVPDIVTFSKGVNSGYGPMGGIIVSRKLADYYEKHGIPFDTTYNAHPISCAAGVAVMEIYKEENLFENAVIMGEKLVKGLEVLCEKHKSVSNARGRGLLTAVDLAKPLIDKGAFTEIGKMFMKKGVIPYTLPRLIMVCPALIVNEDEINLILNAMDEVLGEADNMF